MVDAYDCRREAAEARWRDKWNAWDTEEDSNDADSVCGDSIPDCGDDVRCGCVDCVAAGKDAEAWKLNVQDAK